MPSAGFESTISAGDRTQTCALDRAATGIGTQTLQKAQFFPCITFVSGNGISAIFKPVDFCCFVYLTVSLELQCLFLVVSNSL